MATLAVYAIVLTAAVYLPAFVFFGTEFGLDDIDFTFDECDDFFECFIEGTAGTIAGIADLLVFLFNLVTLGGIQATQIDPTLRFSLLLVIGLMWALIVVGQVRGSAQG